MREIPARIYLAAEVPLLVVEVLELEVEPVDFATGVCGRIFGFSRGHDRRAVEGFELRHKRIELFLFARALEEEGLRGVWGGEEGEELVAEEARALGDFHAFAERGVGEEGFVDCHGEVLGVLGVLWEPVRVFVQVGSEVDGRDATDRSGVL